jgi:tetratricopeptide (TPR) repeat protein
METLESGNGFGAVEWTDGRLEMPMMPRRYTLNYWYCPECNTFQKVSDMKEVDVINSLRILNAESDPRWKEASNIMETGWRKYLDGVKQWKRRLEPYPDWETEIRLLAWRRYNDRYRYKLIKQNRELHDVDTDRFPQEKWPEKRIEVPQQKKMVENCTEIARWLYEGNPDKAMNKADIYRWQNRFKEALKILENVDELFEFDERVHLKRYRLLIKLCKDEDPSLGVVHGGVE